MSGDASTFEIPVSGDAQKNNLFSYELRMEKVPECELHLCLHLVEAERTNTPTNACRPA